MNTTTNTAQTYNYEAIDKLISNVISHYNADLLMHQTGVLPQPILAMYDARLNDTDKFVGMGRAMSSGHFIRKVIGDFVTEIVEKKIPFRVLGFSMSDAKVSGWVEIDDDADDVERELYLIEARINAKYEQYGFGLMLTIIEASDYVPMPSRYQKFATIPA